MLSKLLGDDPVLNVGDVPLFNYINYYVGLVCVIFLSLCGLLVVLFAIYVGFKMAKAEDDKARQDAKQQLIYSVIGVISIILIAVMFGAVVPNVNKYSQPEKIKNLPTGLTSIETTYTTISGVIGSILTLLGTLATVFAVYIGWKLMSAEDDAKRKNAKMQLIYTIVALVAIVLINTIAQTIIGALIDKISLDAPS